jgi:hypothetical protein
MPGLQLDVGVRIPGRRLVRERRVAQVVPQRLERALGELEVRRADRKRLVVDEKTLGREPVLRLQIARGELKLVGEPAGTRRGYDDLRRAATREHIGGGLRPNVASLADLARMAAALGRRQDVERLRELRRIMELEVRWQRTLGLER